jgi:hypothetical protein
MSSSISGLSGAVYKDDLDISSVEFSELPLIDSGDHKTWQAPYGYRFWDPDETLLLEKQVHGAGGWVAITSDCTVNYLQGKIVVSDTLNPDDLVRSSGKRRDESHFLKIANLYDGKLKISGKDIDTTSCEDDGWGSSIPGARSWEFTAGAYYSATEHVDIITLGLEMIVKFYSFNRRGYHISGVSPSTNIDAGSDTDFKIQADEESSASAVTLSVTGKNTGALIAAEMQLRIRALGGVYAAVTVEYIGGRYKISSGTRGPNSKIRITDGTSNNVADNLKIGTANGGTNTDGSSYGWVGQSRLSGIEDVLANPNDAQKETLTIKGNGEVYAES